jgi:hypothetical protein
MCSHALKILDILLLHINVMIGIGTFENLLKFNDIAPQTHQARIHMPSNIIQLNSE